MWSASRKVLKQEPVKNWRCCVWEWIHVLYSAGCICILYICIILLLVEGRMLERSVDLHICAGNNVNTRCKQFIRLKSG